MTDTQPERSAPNATEPGTGSPDADPVDTRGETERPPASAVVPSVVRGGAAAESADEASVARVGQVLAGRYRIEKELGAGGMGAVYRAEHVHMRKAVAIKVLHREMTYLPEVVARFEREAVAAARIEHPHVAAATDFGRLDDGAFYLVLEYVEGRSLREIIDTQGALPPALALHITRQIADALSAAHAAGIVHRDLKPDNVMLIARDGDEYFAKVLDFGIAKVETGDAQNQLTQLGSVFGTPDYMAPEQAAGTPVDARADVYTLGIILYEMLAGTTPFADEDLVVVLTRQMTMPPPPLAGIDPGLASFVQQLLAKDPDQRPQSAADVIALVDAVAPAVATAPPSVAMALTPSPTSVSVVSSATGGNEVAHAATMLSITGSEAGFDAVPQSLAQPRTPGGGPALGTIWDKLPFLRRQVDLGGQKVPGWALVATGLGLGGVAALILVLVVVTGVTSSSGAGPAGSTRTSAARAPSESVELLARRAATGDRAAIAKLQERPEVQRSALEWRALGRGLSAIGHAAPGLQAYEKALALDPALANDRDLVRDVRKAALSQATAQDALRLATASLGSVGADLVYDVWTSTRAAKDKQPVARMAKDHVEGSSVRTKASPALLVTLDLQRAKTCASYKSLLSRVERVGDARALPKLKSLQARRGCGFLGLGDCFACLRTGKLLEDAVKAAEGRAAPTF